MKVKTIKTPIYQMEQVKVREDDTTVYVAIDGKEFTNEKECLAHETNALAIRGGDGLIEEIELNSELSENIISLIFEGYDISSARFFKWKVTTNKVTIDKVLSYLSAKNCRIGRGELLRFNEGDAVLISSWVQAIYGDHPSYETKAIKYEDAIKIIDEISSEIKSVFTPLTNTNK